MSGHTPGPWACIEIHPTATGPAPHVLVVGPKTVPLDRGYGWHIPDGRLIAAAPELLMALELGANGLALAAEEQVLRGRDPSTYLKAETVCRATIAKATGEEPKC